MLAVMELRKDPITRSWVITGDAPELVRAEEPFCRFCADAPVEPQVVSSMASVDGGAWSARAVVHPTPLYHVEGDPQRRAEGIYDRMPSVGRDELLGVN